MAILLPFNYMTLVVQLAYLHGTVTVVQLAYLHGTVRYCGSVSLPAWHCTLLWFS